MFNIARNALLGKAATKDAESQGSQESATSDGPSCGHLLLARVWGSVAAILMMVFGFLSIISCLQWAIYLMCFGFITLILEASFVAGLFDCSEAFSELLGRCKAWQKAIFYCLVSLPPLIGCFGISTLIACVSLFATGVGYGMMFLNGRKMSPHNVHYNAGSDEAKLTLMGNKEEGNDDDGDDAGTNEASAWWPFSARDDQKPAPEAEKRSTAAAAAVEQARPPTEPPKPVMTGTLPSSVLPAFPEPTLGGSTPPRTVAYTGPAVKPVTAAPPPPGVLPSQPGARTVAYTGPLLKPIGDATTY